METLLWVAVGVGVVVLVYVLLTPSAVPASIAERVAAAEARGEDRGVAAEPRPMGAAASVPTAAPTDLRDFTSSSLARYNGVDGASIYIALDGFVFNISSNPTGADFYGPGKGYGVFAGR